MIRFLLFFALLGAVRGAAPRAETAEPVRIDDPAWQELVREFANQPDVYVGFTEQRTFPFRREPVELRGDARVSREHGLSLHYRTPEERIVIVDPQGLLIRDAAGRSVAPADPRARALNEAMLQILRLDLRALAENFDLRGRRAGKDWTLILNPREEALRRQVGAITVAGSGAAVWRIELRHGPKQGVEITMRQPLIRAPFSPEEVTRYFR